MFICLFVKIWLYLSFNHLNSVCHFGVHNDSPTEAGVSPYPQSSLTIDNAGPHPWLLSTMFPSVGPQTGWIVEEVSSVCSGLGLTRPLIVVCSGLGVDRPTRPILVLLLTCQVALGKLVLILWLVCFLISVTSKIS